MAYSETIAASIKKTQIGKVKGFWSKNTCRRERLDILPKLPTPHSNTGPTKAIPKIMFPATPKPNKGREGTSCQSLKNNQPQTNDFIPSRKWWFFSEQPPGSGAARSGAASYRSSRLDEKCSSTGRTSRALSQGTRHAIWRD
jgi:hypothetical protein